MADSSSRIESKTELPDEDGEFMLEYMSSVIEHRDYIAYEDTKKFLQLAQLHYPDDDWSEYEKLLHDPYAFAKRSMPLRYYPSFLFNILAYPRLRKRNWMWLLCMAFCLAIVVIFGVSLLNEAMKPPRPSSIYDPTLS